MGKQDGPLALLPFMKALDGSMSGFSRKIGDNVSQSHATVGGRFGIQTHVHLGSRFHRVHCGFLLEGRGAAVVSRRGSQKVVDRGQTRGGPGAGSKHHGALACGGSEAAESDRREVHDRNGMSGE